MFNKRNKLMKLMLYQIGAWFRFIRGKSREFHLWMFEHETRVVEFMNTVLLLGFTIPFIYNIDLLLATPLYRSFYLDSSLVIWFSMPMIGIIQGWAMIKKGVHSNQFSGYILMVSAWIWGIVSSLFVASAPPLTTAPIICGVIAFTCAMSGLYLLKHNKAVEDFNNGRR